jgi:hypothetical protein
MLSDASGVRHRVCKQSVEPEINILQYNPECEKLSIVEQRKVR